jgi:hypothetical protein
MKDKELKSEEIESSHTLGGSGEGRVQVEVERVQMILGSTVRHTLMHQSHLVL